MNRHTGFSPIYILVVATFAMAIPALSRADLIDDHISAIGGEQAIAKLKTFKRSGKVRLGGMLGNFDGTYEQASVIRSKVYTKVDLGISIEEQGWNGTVGWKRDAQQGLRRIYGVDLSQVTSIAEVDGIVGIYRQYGRAAFTEAKDAMLGTKNCRVLQVVGVPLSFFIDPETKMIAGTRLVFDDPNSGTEVMVLTTYSDYVDFSGVKMPNRMKIDISDGAITLDFTFEKTEIGIKLPDSMFEMPVQ